MHWNRVCLFGLRAVSKCHQILQRGIDVPCQMLLDIADIRTQQQCSKNRLLQVLLRHSRWSFTTLGIVSKSFQSLVQSCKVSAQDFLPATVPAGCEGPWCICHLLLSRTSADQPAGTSVRSCLTWQYLQKLSLVMEYRVMIALGKSLKAFYFDPFSWTLGRVRLCTAARTFTILGDTFWFIQVEVYPGATDPVSCRKLQPSMHLMLSQTSASWPAHKGQEESSCINIWSNVSENCEARYAWIWVCSRL